MPGKYKKSFKLSHFKKVIQVLPLITPIPTPKRRESIVSITGLSIDADNTDNKQLAEALEVLRRNMCDDRLSPLQTVRDVQDFNNSLVFKLPQRRRSFTTPIPDNHSGFKTSLQGGVYPDSIKQTSTDYDEGIGMVEEELIEKSVYIPRNGAPPAALTKIETTLPEDEAFNSRKTAVQQIVVDLCHVSPDDVTPTTEKSDVTHDDDMTTVGWRTRRKDSLGVRSDKDTPRSHSRSEISCPHISQASPRSGLSLSDEEESDEDRMHYHVTDIGDGLEGRASSAHSLRSVGSQPGQFERESLIISLHDQDVVSLDVTADNLDHTITDTDGSKEKPVMNTSRDNSKRKQQAALKMVLPVETIELKELSLSSPVRAQQFSNRQKFGAVPRICTKFLVLGKSPKSDRTHQELNVKPLVRHKTKELTNRTSIITPTLRWESTRRPMTAVVTSRERTVLQQRRLGLFSNDKFPLTDERRNFDILVPGESIQIPTDRSLDQNLNSNPNPNSNRSSNTDKEMMERVQAMEKKILSRFSQNVEPAPRCQSARGRKEDDCLSVIDLSKSMRKEKLHKSGLRSMAPLARVLMAYQSSRRRRQSTRDFSSISRRLERGGLPFTSSSTECNDYSLSQSKTERRRKKNRKCRKPSSDRDTDLVDGLLVPSETEVTTLVSELKDDECDDVNVKEVVRLGGGSDHLSQSTTLQKINHAPLPQSSIVTLEIPRHYRRKTNRLSILSKLPVK